MPVEERHPDQAHLFNEAKAVRVLGIGSINSITDGMRVEYKEASGRIVETKHLVERDNLSRENILWILRNPIETLITTEDGRSEHIVQDIEGIVWRVPILTANAGSIDLTGPANVSKSSIMTKS